MERSHSLVLLCEAALDPSILILDADHQPTWEKLSRSRAMMTVAFSEVSGATQEVLAPDPT